MAFVKIQNLQLYSYHLKLKQPLSLKGSLLDHREGLILKVTCEHGQSIQTDIAPLLNFHTESISSILKIFPQIKKALTKSFWSLKLLLNSENLLSQNLSYKKYPSRYFAIEFALLCHLMPKLDHFQDIKINALLSGADSELELKAPLIRDYESVKLKAGPRNAYELLSLIEKIQPHLRPQQKLRIDFNRSWKLTELLEFCKYFPIELCEYLEEPLENPLELLHFSSHCAHPIAFDESLLDTSLEFLLTIPTKRAFIIKPTLIGSLQKVNYLYSKARLHNLQFILTSAFESGIGHLMVAQLAHYLAIEDPIGLDTYQWLENDVLTKPLEFNKGKLDLKEQHILNPYINWKALTSCYENA